MDESPLFYSIKDVSKQLGLPSHVLRFWETKFNGIKPVHRSGSCRYYRKEDVDLLAKIQDLLHNQGYTIKGAKSILEKPASKKVAAVAESDFVKTEPVVATAVSNANFSAESLEIKEKLLALRSFVESVLSKSK